MNRLNGRVNKDGCHAREYKACTLGVVTRRGNLAPKAGDVVYT